MADVAAFAGLDVGATRTPWLAGVRFPDRNEGWRARLDAAAVATIEAIEGDDLRRHGYA
jgi:hypothetical protein